MSDKNYFKSRNGHVFFFFDNVPESVESAYRAAVFVDDAPSIFRPPQFAGPWDACPIVGHRPRTEILRDLSTETDKEELANLASELQAVEGAFLDAGRPVPLQSVAA